MVSKKINIKLKEHFNSKLFINYIKIIASYILKIKNTNNLYILKNQIILMNYFQIMIII